MKNPSQEAIIARSPHRTWEVSMNNDPAAQGEVFELVRAEECHFAVRANYAQNVSERDWWVN